MMPARPASSSATVLPSPAQLRAAVKDLEAFIAANLDPDLSVKITGQSVLASNAVNDLVFGQIKSLALVVIVIFAVVSLLFVTLKAGLIAVIVNVFPIVGLFGVMALTGIPLDSATSMIAAIAVGVGVDHTMHFMVRYNQHFNGSADELTAVARTIADEAKPIGTATLALGSGLRCTGAVELPADLFLRDAQRHDDALRLPGNLRTGAGVAVLRPADDDLGSAGCECSAENCTGKARCSGACGRYRYGGSSCWVRYRVSRTVT